MHGIQGKTVREMQMNENQANAAILTTNSWSSQPCVLLDV